MFTDLKRKFGLLVLSISQKGILESPVMGMDLSSINFALQILKLHL